MPLCGLLKKSWHEFCVDYGFFTDPPSARCFTAYGCDDLDFGRNIVNHVHYNSFLDLCISLYNDRSDSFIGEEFIKITSRSNMFCNNRILNGSFVGRLDDVNAISGAVRFMDEIFSSESPVITVNKMLYDVGLAVLFNTDRYAFASAGHLTSSAGTIFKAFDYYYYIDRPSCGFGVDYMFDGDDVFVRFEGNKYYDGDDGVFKFKLDSDCGGAVRDVAKYYREKLY